MKKDLFFIFLATCFAFLFQFLRLSFAMDEGGCLTCHKYPGLVMFEKSKGIKVLHIDEDRYLASAHGKVDCRKCHVAVLKVPHTGETKVDCTTECHREDKDKKMIESFDLRSLHNQEQSFISSLNDGSSCRVCHPLYPHSQNNMVRALLNMHTGFMVCEVCHIKRDKFDGLSYEWKDSENAQFVGKPFGTHFNPKTGRTRKPENFISRISVYMTKNGTKRSLMNTWDTKKATQYRSEEENLKPDVKEERLNYFHEGISKKEISVACNECHSTNSILDFKDLGFGEKKAKDLIYINIKGLVTKYKTFYFPNLFND